jgi:hypothetical protein
MNIHPITHLLTFNTADFKAYHQSEIILVSPADVQQKEFLIETHPEADLFYQRMEKGSGASEGIRTLDIHVGNVTLYQTELRSRSEERRECRACVLNCKRDFAAVALCDEKRFFEVFRYIASRAGIIKR